jgi:hypothetical protein
MPENIPDGFLESQKMSQQARAMFAEASRLFSRAQATANLDASVRLMQQAIALQ